MPTLKESIPKVRELLLEPKEQSPHVGLILGGLLREYQNFVNELTNTHTAWTMNEKNIFIAPSQFDYLISGDVGKILFITAWSSDYTYPIATIDFADFADVSNPFFYGYEGVTEWDWNTSGGHFPFEAAFYRKNGNLYMRTGAFPYAVSNLKITYSTGNWIETAGLEDSQVLSEHHHLAEIRTAKNLVEACEWRDEAFDDKRKANLRNDLREQESAAARNFMFAKRSLVADRVTYRDDYEFC